MIKLNLSRNKLGLICAWGPYVSELGGSFAPSLVLMTGPRQRPTGLVAGDLIARRRLAGRAIPATRARALRLYRTSDEALQIVDVPGRGVVRGDDNHDDGGGRSYGRVPMRGWSAKSSTRKERK